VAEEFRQFARREFAIETMVVPRASRWINQTASRRSNLAGEAFREFTLLISRFSTQMIAVPLRGVADYFNVVFEQPQTQQPIVIRRLFAGWNAKPTVVGIE
jgi:hypothetical protein